MEIKTIIKAAAAASGALLGWAAIENTLLLRVRRYQTGLAGMPRTVLLSDLHKRRFGKNQCRLIRKIADLQPECIIIAGDLISRTETDFTAAGALLRRLCKIAPVIVTEGNHETDLPPSLYEDYRRTVTESGAVFLHNAVMQFGNIRIAGLALPASYYRGGKRFGYCGRDVCTCETMHRLLGDCRPDTLLIAHNPLFFPAYAGWGAKLVLSGHVHGGIVRLPLLGGLLSPERTFFPRWDKGHFRLHDTEMIVSAGLGKLRLFNPPEICLLTAETAKN